MWCFSFNKSNVRISNIAWWCHSSLADLIFGIKQLEHTFLKAVNYIPLASQYSPFTFGVSRKKMVFINGSYELEIFLCFSSIFFSSEHGFGVHFKYGCRDQSMYGSWVQLTEIQWACQYVKPSRPCIPVLFLVSNLLANSIAMYYFEKKWNFSFYKFKILSS